MNWLEKWFLKRLCRKLASESPEHKYNITQYYTIMRDVAQEIYTEDNRPTLNGFLEGCHKEAGRV